MRSWCLQCQGLDAFISPLQLLSQAQGNLLAGHEGSESSNQSEGSIVRDSLGFKSTGSLRHSSQVSDPIGSWCNMECKLRLQSEVDNAPSLHCNEVEVDHWNGQSACRIAVCRDPLAA